MNTDCSTNKIDPTKNVIELVNSSITRLDDLRNTETKRIDEKFKDYDVKYQIQFTAAEKAIGIASTAQEKLVAQALEGTKEAISKADVATDKRFELLSEKIDAVSKVLSQNTGAQGIYVTHTDLSNSFDKFRMDIESVLKPLISKVEALTTYQNTSTGKGAGLNMGWVYLLGGLTALGTIVALVLNAIRLTGLGL